MKKDVIYIDIEDDITSVIEKIKASGSKIIALVPPKRVTVLQSIVNLKLLERAGQSSGKKLVLITSDRSLAHLAGSLMMPVAKNLQSRPEVPEVNALEVDDEDIITGETLPLDDSVQGASTNSNLDVSDLSDIDLSDGESDENRDDVKSTTVSSLPRSKNAKNNNASKQKIPNFDKFRKKLFMAMGAGLLALTGVIYWAYWVAPRAEIDITARTSASDVSLPVTLKSGVPLDTKNAVLPATIQRVQKTNSQDFDATGQKDVGEKANGQVIVSNCDTSYSQTILAGTVISSSNLNYVVGADVEVPGATFSGGGANCQPGVSAPVSVIAQDIGENYNIQSGSKFSVAGSSSKVTAAASSNFSGGTKTTVTVVSQDDVNKAVAKIGSTSSDSIKQELTNSLGKNVTVVNESFKLDPSNPTVKPAVGEETKRFSVTVETSYSLAGVNTSDLKTILESQLEDQIKTGDQKVYDSGVSKIKFNNWVVKGATSYAATIKTTGYVGPKIDDQKIAEQSAGKRVGEIEQQLQSIDGIASVKVNMTPSWVNTAPDSSKITVRFLVKN
jgi:copper chaperone CopZ